MEAFLPTSQGSAQAIAQVRMAYAKEAGPLGSVPHLHHPRRAQGHRSREFVAQHELSHIDIIHEISQLSCFSRMRASASRTVAQCPSDTVVGKVGSSSRTRRFSTAMDSKRVPRRARVLVHLLFFCLTSSCISCIRPSLLRLRHSPPYRARWLPYVPYMDCYLIALLKGQASLSSTRKPPEGILRKGRFLRYKVERLSL